MIAEYFLAIGRSFFSARQYREAALSWRGFGALYLLLMVTVALAPAYLSLRHEIGEILEREGPGWAAQLPVITIAGGKAHAGGEPVRITDSEGHVVAVIDTTGATQAPGQAGARVLLTQDAIMVAWDETTQETYPLADMADQTFTPDTAGAMLESLRYWVGLILLPSMIGVLWLWRLAQALFYAGVGALLALPLRAELGYGALTRLAALALTPAAVTDGLLLAFGVSSQGVWLLLLAMTLGYLYFGVRSAARAEA